MKRDRKGRFVDGSFGKLTQFKKGVHGGENHPRWKGGIRKEKGRYTKIYCPEHPRAYKNYVYEHRLIMEKHLGRFLKDKEVVHHINGIKDDNRIENLSLYENNGKHCSDHLKGTKVKK